MDGLQVGRIVHYVTWGSTGGESAAGTHRAAIITALDNYGLGEFLEHPQVSLCVLSPGGASFQRAVAYDGDTLQPGTWHWVEPQ